MAELLQKKEKKKKVEKKKIKVWELPHETNKMKKLPKKESSNPRLDSAAYSSDRIGLNLYPYWITPCFPCSLIFRNTDSTLVPICTSPSRQSTT